jgi:hypothetical protein
MAYHSVGKRTHDSAKIISMVNYVKFDWGTYSLM